MLQCWSWNKLKNNNVYFFTEVLYLPYYTEDGVYKWLKTGAPLVRPTKPILFYNELRPIGSGLKFCTQVRYHGYEIMDCLGGYFQITVCMKDP